MKVKSEDVKDEIEPLKLVLKEKDHQIENLLLEISILKEAANFNLVTRNKDATFTDCVRLCVMELSGLEVAVEKVSPVIQTVCKHLFDIDLDKSQLPSSTTARKKKENQNLELEDEEDYDNNLQLPHVENFTVNDYVAVAYQDDWYPGCVIDIIEKNQAYVKFMTPCSSKGFFKRGQAIS
ncbi:unnamed protein product [Mytilus coruscus]|uniref:Tudor domain-containing protein n=1 Tax=Mytilus coruscus TaxID=42192 RepID=A0A6J8DNS1_MYTCO|nr:unnamed protein product [Mytilus coruscus]